MDEILIGDKKYISSKQAAKLTGYAKDYIGQLCREGRVPARLVGRGWYVLETAISDHRFGLPKGVAEPAEVTRSPARPVFSSTWEAPRYEATEGKVLPLADANKAPAHPSGEQYPEPQMLERLQDSWREWFDRVADSRPIAPAVFQEEEPIVQTVEEEAPKEQEDEAIKIAIHAVHHVLSAELLPRITREYVPPESAEEEAKTHHKAPRARGIGIKAFHLTTAIIAIVIATTAIMGTGYFDTYILSNSQVSALAGIGIYNR